MGEEFGLMEGGNWRGREGRHLLQTEIIAGNDRKCLKMLFFFKSKINFPQQLLKSEF